MKPGHVGQEYLLTAVRAGVVVGVRSEPVGDVLGAVRALEVR
jgi:hypothetical protein